MISPPKLYIYIYSISFPVIRSLYYLLIVPAILNTPVQCHMSYARVVNALTEKTSILLIATEPGLLSI
jgi:hypothetical protein